MSRLSRIWKRSPLRPRLLAAYRRLPGCGSPVPRTSTTVRELSAAGLCERIPLDRVAETVLPPHAVSGDLAAVRHVRSLLRDPAARDRFDRWFRGTVVQPATELFTAVLAGAAVTHVSGMVVTAAGELLEDVSALGFASDDPASPLGLSHLPRARRVPGTVAVLSTGMHHNYFHWLTEALPRLDLYERSGVGIDRWFAPNHCRFQRESLRLLGIPRSRILPARVGSHVAADRLAVASLGGGISGPKIAFLRRLADRVDLPAASAPRLFIPRRKARSIVNEAEVMSVLEPLGFVPRRLETMPLAAQIAAFRDAACVVGPHGAGLTNFAFCRPGTVVIEIGTPYRLWPCFREIAHHAGLDYHLHVASPTRVRHFDPLTAAGDSDMQVDPHGLREAVETALAGAAARTAAA